MSTHEHTTPTGPDHDGDRDTARRPAYATGLGLRRLLRRLHEAGPGAWQYDPEAGELMGYAASKYEPLARKHSLDAWEAASAAFDVMRSRAAREAQDPWAVVTHAVRITCIAEERAQGLLCSVHQARRPHVSAFHDPERFSDRENPLTDYHPAFHITDPHSDTTTTPSGAGDGAGGGADDGDGGGSGRACMSAGAAAEDAIALLVLLGWPPQVARSGVEYVCAALTKSGTRQAAYESLRRDSHALALLDIPGWSWTVLLRTLLGNPHPAYTATSAGRGVLLRLLIGETLPVLLRDDDLILSIAVAAPTTGQAER